LFIHILVTVGLPTIFCVQYDRRSEEGKKKLKLYVWLIMSGDTDERALVPYNLDDYQKLAKTRLPRDLYEYLASGTDDEQTLSENRFAFKMWYLRPRVMRSVSRLSTRTSLFGQTLAMPVFVSPAGVMALCDPVHGECATARACGEAGIMFGLSQHSTRTIEQVAEGAPATNRWYQSYILKDRNMTLRLVKRAVKAGYQGTVDRGIGGFSTRNSLVFLI
jgi:isopentenyl diphosphate isomerase/L-lactate dehydrogenase-like FMN-dependent dehydrogenase